MGRKRKRGRPISGILLLDKPKGLSSNQALQKAKYLYFAQKAGHTGSLDPLATGMLPVCFGEATKISNFLLDADKRYSLTCRLGEITETGDAEGEIIETRPVATYSQGEIEAILQQFVGKIMQVPPMYSALKHNGERLYKLAREGIEVEREAREVEIFSIDLLSMDTDSLELEVHCSKGTYIRTLVEDIGQQLGCGAHVTALRRLAVGPFSDPSMMIDIDSLAQMKEENREQMDEILLPIDAALAAWPEVRLNADLAYYLMQGQPVQVPRAPTSGMVRIYRDDEEQFLGVGEIASDGKVAPKRLFHADQS